MTAQTTDLRPKPPETLVQFLRLLLVGMLKKLPLKLLLAGGIALLAWIIHTYLLVVSNEGFNSGNSFWLDRILALQGRTITGTLVWTLGAGLVTSTIARILAYGFANTMRSVVETPRHILNWATELGIMAIPFLIGGYVLTIFFGFFVNNHLLILQIFLVVLGIIIARHTSILLTILRLGWSDVQKKTKRENVTSFKLAWPGMFLVGELVGLLAILPSGGILPYVCGCLGFLLVVLLSAGLFIRSQGGTEKLVGKKILLWFVVPTLLMLFMMAAAPVFADDGGWQESGGTLSGWLRSPGAARAVLMGLLPAAGSGLGVLLGTALGSMISIVSTAGITSSPFSTSSQPTSAGSSPSPDLSRTAEPQTESFEYQQGQSKPAGGETADPPPLESRTADHQAEQFQQQGKADPNTMPDRYQSEASASDGGDSLSSDRVDQDLQVDQSRAGQGAEDTGPGQRDVRGVDPQASSTSGSTSEPTGAAASADRVDDLEPNDPTGQLSARQRPESDMPDTGPMADRNQPGGLAEQEPRPGQLTSQRADSDTPDTGPMAERNQPGGLAEQEPRPGQLTSQRADSDSPDTGPMADRHQPGGMAETDAVDAKPAGLEQGGLDASRHTPSDAGDGPLSSRHDPDISPDSGSEMRARRFTEPESGPTAERFSTDAPQDSPGLIHSRHSETADPEIPLPPVPIPPVNVRWELVVIRTPAESGLEPQQRLQLSSQTRIGRHGTIDIKILDPKVSRQHADIEIQADKITLTDLNSSNGTYLNGKRMATPQALQPGDAIKIGDTYFVVEQSAN